MASPGNQHCANCIGTLSFPGTALDLERVNFCVSHRVTPDRCTAATSRHFGAKITGPSNCRCTCRPIDVASFGTLWFRTQLFPSDVRRDHDITLLDYFSLCDRHCCVKSSTCCVFNGTVHDAANICPFFWWGDIFKDGDNNFVWNREETKSGAESAGV